MTVAEIELCPEDQPDKPSAEIEVCPPEPAKIDLEIEVCPEEEQPDLPSPCDSVPVLALSGNAAANVDDVYTATGGLEPYTFEFDTGTIDSNGKILTIDSCGAQDSSRLGTITVTDFCGSEESVEVRLPGGYWKFKEYFGPNMEYLMTHYTSSQTNFDNRAIDAKIHYKKLCHDYYDYNCGNPCIGGSNSCYYYPTSWTIWRHYGCCNGPADRSTLSNWLSPENVTHRHQTDYQGGKVYEWVCP